jgi:hypothetical protein
MERGLFLMPTETLNELMKIKAFNQQPTIDSITQALNEKRLLIHETGKLLNRQRINGTRVYGWYIRASPPHRGEGKGDAPHTEGGKGDAKNDSIESIVPSGPPIPREKERKIFSYENQNKTSEKIFSENREDKGDKGDREREEREIDSDYHSNNSAKSVPFTVPPDEVEGDRLGKCGMGPHPRKDAPTPICAKCGDDLTGHSQFTMNGKLYCAKPGCGYPARGDAEVSA